jgi:hypothetical protein
MHNVCPVGGFEIHITTSDPSWLAFTPGDTLAADRAGGRITDWEWFAPSVYSANPGQIIIAGIADMPGGVEGVKLPPGDGLLFNLHINYANRNVCDSSQLLDFTLVRVSDTTGNCLIDNIELVTDSVHVLPGDCNNNPRGDANCSGTLTGLDVTYLVRYFKGSPNGYCCLCSGDANSSGTVSGVDVTYLVGFFKGRLPQPAPCR